MTIEKIPLSPQKKKRAPKSITIVDHENLTPDERKALYTFYTENPDRILGEERKKRKHKSIIKKCKCKK